MSDFRLITSYDTVSYNIIGNITCVKPSRDQLARPIRGYDCVVELELVPILCQSDAIFDATTVTDRCCTRRDLISKYKW